MNAYGLYKISEQLLITLSQIEEDEGVLTPETESALAINQEELTQKCTDFDKAGKLFDSQVAMIDQEIERLGKMKKIINNGTNRLDEALLQAVLLFGEQKKPTKAQIEKNKEGTKFIEVHDESTNFKLSNTQRDVLIGPEEYPDEIQINYGKRSVEVQMLDLQDVVSLLQEANIEHRIVGNLPTVSRTALKQAIEEGKDCGPYSIQNKHYLRKT
ncbi:hypothetical protein LCGC14_0246240 [marine sediment metagenome]|uniref:Uncharacterized protein n=1 Tax=marine sediment metagenome TaxID=412755 RepID=A0A0F9XAN9_9ZZZZ